MLSIGFVELEFSEKGELKNMWIQMKNKQEKGFKQLPQKKNLLYNTAWKCQHMGLLDFTIY